MPEDGFGVSVVTRSWGDVSCVTGSDSRSFPRIGQRMALRFEAAIQLTPQGRLGSTTKGGRPREVSVRSEAQRKLLDEVGRWPVRGQYTTKCLI